MIVHDVAQGSPEWQDLRLGIPTASCFDQIITPTGKESTQADKYANKLVAEILTGKPLDIEATEWMNRGNELEDDAAQFYSFQNEVEALKVGFVTDINKTVGCSPDRLLGDDGLLEIKCCAPWTHVEYMLNQKIDQKYYPQLQGQLLITGRKWVDIISYHPEMQPVIIRVEQDIPYQSLLSELLEKLKLNIHTKLIKLGH